MSGYQGMRWFKCDLQVQTPEDGRHWDPEDPLRLGSPRQEHDLQEKARQYLRRCHEVGLEVIGVTDHNFCARRKHRDRFLTHLIEQNQTVASEVARDPLWIFPGFEVNIGYHVLCLFPPERKSSACLDGICDVLTRLGLRPTDRVDASGIRPLRRDGREVSLSELLRAVQREHGGIVIAAHAFRDDGIAAESRGAGDFQNEDLLCVEVTSFPLKGREKAVLEATAGRWMRVRPPAYIMSSDAKSTLKDESGQPRPNSLGYRSTWIKMSEPSIEALRQAFLDGPSRIRLEGDPRTVFHDWIESLRVQGTAFLEDQEVHFSPHLNCFIGGRGSGKSSLLEYLRFALRREDSPSAPEPQIARIRETLNPDSLLVLKWRERDGGPGESGLEDTFEFRPAVGRSQVVSREVTDASTVFQGLHLQIFSQREISSVARKPDFLLGLIDDLVGRKLKPLRQQETELTDRIRGLQNQSRTLERLRSEVGVLEQEVQDLERRWAARSAIQEEQRRHRIAQEAQRHLDEVAVRVESLADGLEQQAADLAEWHPPLGSGARNWPESAFFETLDQEIERAGLRLAEEIRQAAARYRSRIAEVTMQAPGWPAVQEAILRAEQDFREACSRQGLRPEDLDQLLQLDQQRKAKAFELEAKRSRTIQMEKAVQDLDGHRRKLVDLWREQTVVRIAELDQILRGREISTLQARIDFQADRTHFLRHWSELAPDARTRLGKQWDDLGEAAFNRASELGSPWEVVRSWLSGAAEPPLPTEQLETLREELLERKRELWDAKQLVRIQDDVDLVLYRSDGMEVGSLRENKLSEGQTNTAILMLLLASSQGPILIDQPEDELDSSFIFQQLVPLLREVKSRRQVILVTHNPNLPVNGDAELVYALRAEVVEGRARGVLRAQGGLDREDVKDAVLDIMEGSEEAFRRRGEKYHF